MEKIELSTLFEEKIKDLEEKEKQKRKKVYEVNLKYAEEYLSIIMQVLQNMKEMNKAEDIPYIDSFIGEFNSPTSQEKSTAVLRKKSLLITLYFDRDPFKTPSREREYDEEIINTLLKKYGVTISTILPDKNNSSQIIITYSYEKEKNYVPISYEETRELTERESKEVIALMSILKEYNLDDYITLGLPTPYPSIYLYKTSPLNWTVCSKIADYGLENPQFFDTLTRAILEVFKRLRINIEIKEAYDKKLAEVKETDPEYTVEIYGYNMPKEKRL